MGVTPIGHKKFIPETLTPVRLTSPPALAIFAVEDSPRDAVDFYDQLDSAGRADAEKFFTALREDSQAQIATFKNQTANCEVVELHNASHYVFSSNEETVLKRIRQFLR